MLLEVISKERGWLNLKPVEICAMNAFGNVIVRSDKGDYWRIVPEDLKCEVIAKSEHEYQALWADKEFLLDWEMKALVALAYKKLGSLKQGQSYCLKLPATIGGSYTKENLGIISTHELIGFSGDIARQIINLPNKSKITIHLLE